MNTTGKSLAQIKREMYIQDQVQLAIPRLESFLTRASSDQMLEGLNWYYTAHRICQDLAISYDIALVKVVGILSALSPNNNNKWQRNIEDLEALLKNPTESVKVCTYGVNKRKALTIYGLNELYNDDNDVRKILNGRKTQSFFDNILDPFHNRQVTVDLWMYRAVGLKNTDRNYEAISQSILELAGKYSMRPLEVQAVIWGVIRDGQGSSGMEDKRELKRA